MVLAGSLYCVPAAIKSAVAAQGRPDANSPAGRVAAASERLRGEIAKYGAAARAQGVAIPYMLGHGTLVDSNGHTSQFLATSLVQGVPLLQAADQGLLPPARLPAVAESARAALAQLHACGVAHCDLLPSNVLLEPGSGRVWLVDLDQAEVNASASQLESDMLELEELLGRVARRLRVPRSAVQPRSSGSRTACGIPGTWDGTGGQAPGPITPCSSHEVATAPVAGRLQGAGSCSLDRGPYRGAAAQAAQARWHGGQPRGPEGCFQSARAEQHKAHISQRHDTRVQAVQLKLRVRVPSDVRLLASRGPLGLAAARDPCPGLR